MWRHGIIWRVGIFVIAMMAQMELAVSAPSGLSVRYQFTRSTDEALADLSGHGHHGTDVFAKGDNAWLDTPIGPVVQFSDEQDRISVPYASFPGKQGQTRMRLRIDDLRADQVLTRVYSVGGDGLRLRVVDGQLRFDYYHRAQSQWLSAKCPASALQAGQWHDLGASWSAAGGLVVHIDGKIAAVQELNLTPDFGTQGTVTIGNVDQGGHHLHGALALFEMDKNVATAESNRELQDRPQKDFLVFTDEQVLGLANQHMGILFSKKYAVPVGSIRGEKNDAHASLLTDQYQLGDLKLWDVTLTADHGRGPSLSFDNLDRHAKPSVQIERVQDGMRASLKWDGLQVPDAKEAVTVHVTVDLPNDSKLSYWRLNIDMPATSKWGVDHIQFPLLRLAPPASSARDVRMALPYRWGLNLPDPFYVEQQESSGDQEKEYQRITDYPANMHMQFFALCGESGESTYFATYDGQGFSKQYEFTALPTQEIIRLAVTHHPEERGQKSYRMSYPCVLGVFEGDWYDATQIYRQWAVQQSWCAKGPLSERRDSPDWITQVDITVKNSMSPGRTLESNVACLDKLTQAFGGPILSCWYHWNEYDPARTIIPQASLPETADNGRSVVPKIGVTEALSHFKKIGVNSTAYVNSKVYEQGVAPDDETRRMEPAGIRNEHGEIPLYNKTTLPQWLMCRASTLWQDQLVERTHEIMNAGFRGVYFDSFGRDEQWCFSDDHGHPVAGGNVGTNGQHRLAERVIQAAREHDADAVLISEASVEYFIDVIDAKLLHYDVLENGCPLWMAVYHDYQTYFGRSFGSERDATPHSYRLRLGNLFINGGQLGRLFAFGSSGHYPLTDQNADELAYFQQLMYLRKTQREFLTLGSMLRPVRIEPTPELARSDSGRAVDVPSILTSSWQSADGRVGTVVVNANDEPRDIDLVFDAVEYGFDEGSLFRVDCHGLDASGGNASNGRQLLSPQVSSHAVRIDQRLNATEAILLEFSVHSSN